MTREIQPLHEPTRRLDPVYLPGKHGGQYMMHQDGDHWVVRGQREPGLQAEGLPPYARIGAWEEPVARRVLDYCVEHDITMRTALQRLYNEGEPDLFVELVEKAKEPRERSRRGTIRLEFDISFRDGAILDAIVACARTAAYRALEHDSRVLKVYPDA